MDVGHERSCEGVAVRRLILRCTPIVLLFACSASEAPAQIVVPMHRILPPAGIPQDWAKYGESDWHKYGYDYFGHGVWAAGWIGGFGFGGGSSTNFTPGFRPVYIPYYYPSPVPQPTPLDDSPGNAPPLDWVHAPRIDERVPLAKLNPRQSTFEARQRAVQSIAAGDASFHERHYPAAAERYKSAVAAAPELAEAHFRLGFALNAQKRPVLAGKAFRRGLEVRHDWNASTFQLATLFGEDPLDRVTESLIKMADADPNSADLAIALGMQLFFSGQRDRSGVYFNRAAFLGANDGRLLDEFMPGNTVAEAPDAKR